MSRPKSPTRRRARRGYTMALVMVLLVGMLAILATTQRRLDGLLRVETRLTRADLRSARTRALGRAIDLLYSGPPPSDPYICRTTIETPSGPKTFTVTFRRDGSKHYDLRVEPSDPSDSWPVMPSSF